MARKKATRKKKSVKVDSLKHRDKRKNIPTDELRDFVAGKPLSPRRDAAFGRI